MPLTPKGRKILQKMQEEYGARKGEAVFYASLNKGKITGVDLHRESAPPGRRRWRRP